MKLIFDFILAALSCNNYSSSCDGKSFKRKFSEGKKTTWDNTSLLFSRVIDMLDQLTWQGFTSIYHRLYNPLRVNENSFRLLLLSTSSGYFFSFSRWPKSKSKIRLFFWFPHILIQYVETIGICIIYQRVRPAIEVVQRYFAYKWLRVFWDESDDPSPHN